MGHPPSSHVRVVQGSGVQRVQASGVQKRMPPKQPGTVVFFHMYI